MPVTLLRPYCSVTEVRAVCGNNDTAIEDKLKESINTASRFIEDLLRRDFVLHDHSSDALVVHKASVQKAIMGLELYLPYAPIIQITEIDEDGTVLIEHDEFEIDTKLGIVARIGAAAWGDVITIKCKLGYDNSADVLSPAPELVGSVRAACAKIAAAWSGENKREQIGFDGKKVPLTDKTIPKDAWDLLCPLIPSNT